MPHSAIIDGIIGSASETPYSLHKVMQHDDEEKWNEKHLITKADEEDQCSGRLQAARNESPLSMMIRGRVPSPPSGEIVNLWMNAESLGAGRVGFADLL